MSSDWLFIVRAREPRSSESEISLPKVKHIEIFPTKCKTLDIGDICEFKKPQCVDWKMGKVLQFFISQAKLTKHNNVKKHG